MSLRYGFSSNTLRARTTITLEVDSAGYPILDSMTSVADLLISARTDSAALFRADGIISAFTRSPYRRLDPGTAAAVIPQLRFVALRSDTMLRIVAQPALDNECDREETAALALISELLVPLPATLTVGDRWTDVARTFACRGNVPMTTEWRSTYTVDSLVPSAHDSTTIAAITRAVELEVGGAATTAWPKTELRARGSGRLHYLVRVPDAAPVLMTGETTLSLVVTSSDHPATPARITQRTVYRVETQSINRNGITRHR